MPDPQDMEMLRSMLRQYGSQPVQEQNPLDAERVNNAAGGRTMVYEGDAFPGWKSTYPPSTGEVRYAMPTGGGGSLEQLLAARAGIEAMRPDYDRAIGREAAADENARYFADWERAHGMTPQNVSDVGMPPPPLPAGPYDGPDQVAREAAIRQANARARAERGR